jgi:hypothetical protein
MARGRKAIYRPDALSRQFPEKLAKACAFSADQRDIAIANLAKIEDVGFCVGHIF